MANHEQTAYSLDKLQFDILQAVTAPMDSLQGFMTSVLNCFRQNISSYGYLFYRYDEDPVNLGEYTVADPISFGLPKSLYGDSWKSSYYKTSIFNPNSNRSLLRGGKNVFAWDEVVTPEEYERSRNYQELIRPAGIYYSFAIILKHDGRPIGHITLSRSKEDGDFNREQLARIETISNTICNRLLDYSKLNCYENLASLESFFERHIFSDNDGVILLNENRRVIFYNERAAEFASEVFGVDELERCSELGVQCLADKMALHIANRSSSFDMVTKSGKNLYFMSTPCFITGRKVISKAYLVEISADCIVEVSAPDGTAEVQSLTRRQMEIIRFISEGMSNREIAQKLMISENTVKKHVENIRVLLGVSSRIGILKKLNMI